MVLNSTSLISLPCFLSSSTPWNLFLNAVAMPFPILRSALTQCTRESVSGQANKSPVFFSNLKPCWNVVLNQVPVKCEMKRETKRNETKFTKTKRNKIKWNTIYWNETKQNETTPCLSLTYTEGFPKWANQEANVCPI